MDGYDYAGRFFVASEVTPLTIDSRSRKLTLCIENGLIDSGQKRYDTYFKTFFVCNVLHEILHGDVL